MEWQIALGKIIEPTTDHIVEAVSLYMSDVEDRKALSRQEIQCAEQALSFNKHGEAVIGAYQNLLG